MIEKIKSIIIKKCVLINRKIKVIISSKVKSTVKISEKALIYILRLKFVCKFEEAKDKKAKINIFINIPYK